MKAARFAIALVLTTSLCLAESPGERDSEDKPQPKPIREFPVETLARLGREIYRHDQLAWVATDLIMQQMSTEQMAAGGAAGWIVDAKESGPSLVRFLRVSGESFEAFYDVTFPQSGSPKVRLPMSRKLTPPQLARAKAVRTAVDAYVAASLPWCGGQFNSVVLDDPDGSGFLVYLLRPMPAHDVIPIGGHYRITVSANGATAEQIDQLFVTCLAMNPRENAPKGSDPVAAAVGHLVSSTPLETHVFLSLQAKLPMYVTTPDARIWIVANGAIASITPGADGEEQATDSPKP